MKIRSMTATFGKLDHARLELGDGLNLIYAPNEGGKSTWAAFWKAMLYGIDTRDRDKKGYLADKNRYQPWSGAPMEGTMDLEWQGRDITLRRGPKGSAPFGAFSAVYTGTEEAVPGLTAANCGELLTGVGREVFERSAFIGSGGDLAVTAAPELERRIAALVSSGEEDVSYSQTEGRLREWLNRRKVNRSVGLIPRLEGELREVDQALEQLEELSGRIALLEGERTALSARRDLLAAERATHRRLAQRELDRRFAQAREELEAARSQLATLEGETAKYGPLPDKDLLKKAQGELQYLKVLDEELRQGEAARKEAEEVYVQAQIAAQDDRFPGMTWEEGVQAVQKALSDYNTGLATARVKGMASKLFPALGLLFALIAGVVGGVREGQLLSYPLYAGGFIFLLTLMAGFVNHTGRRAWEDRCAKLLERYRVQSPQELEELAQDYRRRCQAAEEAARQVRTIRGTLSDRQARRDNSRTDLLDFVHTFSPQVTDLFGCSAALSRGLNLDHELSLARERVEERRRRLDDLEAQGGGLPEPVGEAESPARTPEETERALAETERRLAQTDQDLNQALGQRKAVGDPAALAARREELAAQLDRRQEEYRALAVALEALKEANAQLQQRFSPELNRLSGQYLARLTGQRYQSVALNRELEGAAARIEDVSPRNALFLSRGTADQLYLSVRLAVCGLCLPEKPPILLDDALAAFDDRRMVLALELLEELAREQQVLLFTCQRREGAALEGTSAVTRLEL